MQKVKIIYKDIQNIILRVKPSLEVVLSVPKDASAKEIEYVLHKRKDWIEKRVEEFKRHLHLSRELISGEDIFYLGKRYRLKVLSSKVERVELKGGYLEISVRDKKDYQHKEALIKAWYQQKAKSYFKELLDKYTALLGCNQIQTFRIKEMKTRWGSCNLAKAYINLNLELIKKDKKAIEYVVLHELAHLGHPNHSRDFWDFVKLYMPDYQERRKLLNQTTHISN